MAVTVTARTDIRAGRSSRRCAPGTPAGAFADGVARATRWPARGGSLKSPASVDERSTVELRIGIQHAPRELTIETEQSPADIEALVQRAFDESAPLIRIVDDKQRVHLVQTAGVLYVELSGDEPRRVGFIA